MSRNIYDVNLKCSVQTADNYIKTFLAQTGFVYKPDNNGGSYVLGSNFTDAERHFIFVFNGNQSVHIEAWFKSIGEHTFGEESSNIHLKETGALINTMVQNLATLEDGSVNNVSVNNVNYNQPVNNNVNYNQPVNNNVNYNQPINNVSSNQNLNYNVNAANEEIAKKKDQMLNLAFILSIVSVVLSLFGYMLGIIFIIIEFGYGIMGLKTEKKGKAIATIVLSSLSFVILIIQILLSM